MTARPRPDEFGMKRILSLYVVWSLSTACAAQEANDWLIVPGERVGPITATTSEAMLGTLFGAANVEPGDIGIGEGFTEPGAVIYGKDPAKRIEVLWRDATRTVADSVWISGAASDWKTSEGVSLGTALNDIERLNGGPFRLAGFDWDYGGTIVDCEGGQFKVIGCTDTNGRVQGRLLLLRLRPVVVSDATAAEHAQVSGEGPFSSGHSVMQVLNPRVYQMIVTFKR
jgi:hypothetical protein